MQTKPLAAFAMFALTMGVVIAGESGDLKKMAGTWRGTILEIDGKPPTDGEKSIAIKLLIKGDRYTVFFDEKKIGEGTFKLDEKKKPKAIDATASEGDAKGKVQLGIYELSGDELKVIFSESGKERPREFKTREKGEEILIRYQRQKVEK